VQWRSTKESSPSALRRKSGREERNEQRRWIERSYGSVTRDFILPANTNASHMDASFEDGVLTAAILKPASPKTRTVAIKRPHDGAPAPPVKRS